MDVNAFTTPFQFTKVMHRDLYPAIDPSNPALSAAGKTILITGATGGVGGEVARAWALAGAKGIALTGRKADLLKEPAEAIAKISPSTKLLTLSVDLTSESGVHDMFKQVVDDFGTIDVVLHAAGAMSSGSAGVMKPSEWFWDFEVNVKGSYTLAAEYLKTFKSGTIIFLGTLGASMTVPSMSSYAGSKLALLKLAEFLDAENSELRVFTIHPGIVGTTDTGRGAVVDALTPLAIDKGIQAGGLSLYLSQSRANYLRGSFISVNWDVEEMENHQHEIKDKSLLKLAFLNARLGPEGHPWAT